MAGILSTGNNPGVPSEQKQERMISSIDTDGSWVFLYDEKGNKYKTLTASYVGEVKGWSSTFFVSRNGSWIYLWDSNGNKYRTLTYSYVGDVIGVAGDTFTSRNGSWIYTWNKKGDKINTRTAH
ncbi:MAG: hypothetical protein IKX26_05290 [Bacteroidales bacterium]|nr:hypothetical protein [Bacteroidales bacterium]